MRTALVGGWPVITLLFAMAGAVMLVPLPNRETRRARWLVQHRSLSVPRPVATAPSRSRAFGDRLPQLSVESGPDVFSVGGVRIVQGFLVLVVAAVLVWHWGVGSTFLAVGALVFLTLTVRARRGRRLEELIRTDTRHVVRTLHDESASGATVIDALAAARDESRYHRGELGEAVNRTVRGHNPVDALATNPQLRPIALSLSVSADAGSSLCAVLSGLDRQLAGEEAGREALAVALAGPRSSASLLGLLPVGGLMLGTVLGVDPLAVLMHTHTGQLALIVGLVLNGVGALWTARLIAAACR